MKTLVTTICLFLCIGMGALNAQIKKPRISPNTANIPSRPVSLPSGTLNNTINLESIKQHLKNKKMCYVTSLAANVTFPAGGGNRVKNIQGRFVDGSIREERNYLRLNTKLLRSDQGFNTSRGDTFEVLIYPDRSNAQLVDKNQVKLTWRSPENGLKTFNLRNVSVSYKPYGILITGDYEIDGKTLVGVSIGIIPEACLI